MTPATFTPDWPAPTGVRTVITTRQGGASAGPFASFNLGTHVGDDPADVAQNRDALRRLLPAEPLWLRQVHGTTVIDGEDATPGAEADGAVTRTPGLVLAVLTADCLPVLLCDRRATVVAVAHAGWRGLAAGVIEKTVSRMGSEPCDLVACIGPAISAAMYEVGVEVRAAFVNQDKEAEGAFSPGRPGHFLADLPELARQRLRKTGIMSVHGGHCCTFKDKERFFSYRRDGETGRMASLIWLAS
jgi:YfiH family protein